MCQAASIVSSIGSTIDGSSFSGLLTRVDIGHIRIRSAGNGPHRVAGVALVTEPADVILRREYEWHPVVNFSHQFIGIGRDNREVLIHSPVAGSFQFSHRPPMPNGLSAFMAA